MAISTLPMEWKARARSLRRWASANEAATAWETAAAELEQALSAEAEAALNLTRASAISGYSADHLGRLVRQGAIPNAGRRNAPRIRLADLPRKPGHTPPAGEEGPPPAQKGQVARTLILLRKQPREQVNG